MIQYNTSNIMRRAWAFAREIARVSPGTKARDWLGYALKDAWKQEKIDNIVAKNLPIVVYHYGERAGGIPIGVFVSSSHDAGSGTFWLENRGKGRGGPDDLDPNEYGESWEDAGDFSISEAMTILSNAGALGAGVVWVASISKPVYADLYNDFIMRGGNVTDLLQWG